MGCVEQDKTVGKCMVDREGIGMRRCFENVGCDIYPCKRCASRCLPLEPGIVSHGLSKSGASREARPPRKRQLFPTSSDICVTTVTAKSLK